MANLIVIIGITGKQGSSVASTFFQLPSWKIRGTTRDPTRASARQLAAKGIEIVAADLNDTSTLIPAFLGATAIYAITDFWAPMTSPQTASLLLPSQTLNQYSYALELQQGKNIADAAAAESTLKTLKRFVYSTLSDVRRWSGGKFMEVWHFDSKAAVEAYVRREKRELAERMSTVQIGNYVDNWETTRELAPRKQADGTFVLLKPGRGDRPIPFLDTQKDTGALVRALVEAPEAGVDLLGYSRMMTWEEYMKLWCEIVGVKGTFREVSVDEYAKGFPESLARELAEGYAYQIEFGWEGGDPDVVHPKDLGIEAPTSSVEDYIKNTDWSFLL